MFLHLPQRAEGAYLLKEPQAKSLVNRLLNSPAVMKILKIGLSFTLELKK